MANIVATDVSFVAYNPATAPLAPTRRTTGGPNPRIVDFGVISFGGGAQTYPAGGIPINHNLLSMPAFIESIWFPDATDGGSGGFLWEYDLPNQKIRGYTAIGTEIATNAAVAARTLDAVITGF